MERAHACATLVHHTGVLLVHREACTRMHTVEKEKEFGGKGGRGEEGRKSKACNGVCTRVCKPSCIARVS